MNESIKEFLWTWLEFALTTVMINSLFIPFVLMTSSPGALRVFLWLYVFGLVVSIIPAAVACIKSPVAQPRSNKEH